MYQEGVFFNGGMNTDDEDRLIPNGDYRYAAYSRNYGVNTPMEGAIQSMTGNELQVNDQLAAGVNVIIGSCEDVESKALILFIWNENGDHSIWRYYVEYSSYELILQDVLLNFKKSNQIYHASVVNNLLYWTDNYFGQYADNDFNPPRKINIAKAIRYTESGGTSPRGYSEITFNNLDWIKHPPLFSPYFSYNTDFSETANNLKNKLFQFRYQYVYDDNEESAWSPISEMTLPNYSEYINQTVNIDPSLDNNIKVYIETGSSITRLIRVAYRIGNTGEFFLYKEYDKNQLGWSDYSTESVFFKNETSGPAISNSERNYDLIPQIAKTIEYLPSNEFAIGNYLEGYDKQNIAEGDVSFAVQRVAIENTAFTYPLASFYCDASGGFNYLYISFNPVSDTFTKYRYQPGDIVVLQLKAYASYFSSVNITAPDPAIYFVVPYIDPTIYTTDQLKLNQLCVELQSYIGTLGLASTVMAASSWNPSVTWPTLKIIGKTWYNRTQAQLLQDTNGTIVVFRENKSTRTFKSGATHEFAFQYYDRANRDGTVLTVPAGEVYVPFNTELSDLEINLPTGLNKKPYYNTIGLTISSGYQPPMWADTYQIVYKPSTNIANFQQRSVKEVIFNADSTAKLVLENYYKNNILGASINQTPSKGDFVRFVRQRALFEKDSTILCLFSANASSVVIPYASTGSTGFLSLSSYIIESYDAGGNLVLGVFTAPTAGTYTFTVCTSLSFNYTGTAANGATAQIMADVPGSDVSIASGFVTYSSNAYSFDLDGYANITLAAGATVSFYCMINLTTSSPPATLTVTTSNSSYNISRVGVDYDNFQYYPSYTTQNCGELAKQLNVLSYDPAGGPQGEEVVVVNNFDPNLLGKYLVFSGSSTSRSIATGGLQIEIYTPKTESENDPWYEVGIEFPVLDPHTDDRSHGGDEDQAYNKQNGFVYLNCGDIYIRQRVMSTGYKYTGSVANIRDANDNVAGWFCEDPHYSDFYTSNWNNKGRLGLFSPFAKQQHLKASIYHTNALIDNTQINGLSRIEFFNNIVLKDEHGGINKLMQIGDTLKAFQDKKISSVYIQKAFALNGDGTNNVILSDKTFAGIRPHDDDYGCIHPGSVAKVENNVFFYDFYNAAVVQATQGGLINVCDGPHKFSVGIRTFTNDIRDYELGGLPINIVSHINRSNGEYVLYSGTNLDVIPNSIQFTDFAILLTNFIQMSGNYTSIFEEGVVFTIAGAEDQDNNGTYTVASSVFGGGKTNITVVGAFESQELKSPGIITVYSNAELNGQNIVYSFNRQRWSSYMFQPVLWATQFGNRAYTIGGNPTINIGELYEEDGGDELNFFDEGRMQQIDFVFNSNPTIIKRFLTFMTQSNMPFRVKVSVPPTNQYPIGMASNILINNFRNQESYYVSKYFRDSGDPNPYILGVLKRINGRELRGYVLKHSLTNSDSSNKMILFSANVNFVPSEPLMQ